MRGTCFWALVATVGVAAAAAFGGVAADGFAAAFAGVAASLPTVSATKASTRASVEASSSFFLLDGEAAAAAAAAAAGAEDEDIVEDLNGNLV